MFFFYLVSLQNFMSPKAVISPKHGILSAIKKKKCSGPWPGKNGWRRTRTVNFDITVWVANVSRAIRLRPLISVLDTLLSEISSMSSLTTTNKLLLVLPRGFLPSRSILIILQPLFSPSLLLMCPNQVCFF